MGQGGQGGWGGGYGGPPGGPPPGAPPFGQGPYGAPQQPQQQPQQHQQPQPYPAPQQAYPQPPPGYGPPPQPYGAPPQPYGAPPQAQYAPYPQPAFASPPVVYGPQYGVVPQYGLPMASGSRTIFHGEGASLFALFLLFGVVPVLLVAGVIVGVGAVAPDVAAILGPILGLGAELAIGLFLTHKFLSFYYGNLIVEGQRLEYRGTAGGLFGQLFVSFVLTALTLGIYAPWAFVRLKKYAFANVAVNGQLGRLTFDGEGASLLGTYLLGMILTYLTLGIYGPWFANNVFAFLWDHAKLDGRPFRFAKDPGGFFGTYLLVLLLTYCTLGFYLPWGMCKMMQWESERVT